MAGSPHTKHAKGGNLGGLLLVTIKSALFVFPVTPVTPGDVHGSEMPPLRNSSCVSYITGNSCLKQFPVSGLSCSGSGLLYRSCCLSGEHVGFSSKCPGVKEKGQRAMSCVGRWIIND